MNELSGNTGAIEFKRTIKPKRPIGKWVKRLALVLAVIGAIAGSYVTYLFLRPLYVIDGISITRNDVKEYAKALDEYKAEQPQVDFGEDHTKVATDDLVLNAAYKHEMKKHEDQQFSSTLEVVRNTERNGSIRAQRMQLVRAENSAYRRYLESKIIATRDFLTVSVPFNTPFYDNKTPEETVDLHKQSTEILRQDFLPLISNNAHPDHVASIADVNTLDQDPTDDENWEQYFNKLVSAVDVQKGFKKGVIKFNDTDQVEYAGVRMDDLRNTEEEMMKLEKVGQHTGIFASKTGNFMIVRLEKLYGGEYLSWDDFLKQYKVEYATSKFHTYDLSPSKAIGYLGDQTILLLTTPGLQTAQAASCGSHNVTFHIVSFDDTVNAPIPNGTNVSHSRGNHNCGSQFSGTRTASSALLDNCLGPAPSWSVISYADPSKYALTYHHTADLNGDYQGWPKWVASRINGASDIMVIFRYIQHPPAQAITLNNVENKTCDLITGWVFNSSVPGGIHAPVRVHVYFDAPVGNPEARGFDAGDANLYRPDVGAAYPGVGDHHGFSFSPSAIASSIGLDLRDGNSHTAYFYSANSTIGSNHFTSITIPPCAEPRPTPPIVSLLNATCEAFSFIATDPDNATQTFNYSVRLSDSSGARVDFNQNNVTGNRSISPWPVTGVSFTSAAGLSWRVTATEVGGAGQSSVVSGNIPRCPFNEATITIENDTTELRRDGQADDENPNQVKFGATFKTEHPNAMRGVDIECKYYISPSPSNPITRINLVGVSRNINLTSAESYSHSCGDDVISLDSYVLKAGDQVCAEYSAKPGSALTRFDGTIIQSIAADNEVLSGPWCDSVANKPYVSVYGSDVRAGGSIDGLAGDCTSSPTSKIEGFNKFGSGSSVQFAAFALGGIGGVQTASTRAGGPGGGLAFQSHGAYKGGCDFDYYLGAPTTNSPGLIPGLRGTHRVSGGSSLGAIVLNSNNKLFLYVDGDAIINDSIVLDSSGSSHISELPAFYLIAKGNIFISPGVTRIDGVFVAQRGTIHTCSNPAGDGSVVLDEMHNNCGNQLTINGSFIAKKTVLGRTYGSLRDSSLGEYPSAAPKNCSKVSGALSSESSVCASEVFRFSPSIYLAESPARSGSESHSKKRQYDFVSDLPPLL